MTKNFLPKLCGVEFQNNKIEKDEPYVGDYGLTVSDNEDECEFTVAINFCPMCGRKLTNQSTAQ